MQKRTFWLLSLFLFPFLTFPISGWAANTPDSEHLAFGEANFGTEGPPTRLIDPDTVPGRRRSERVMLSGHISDIILAEPTTDPSITGQLHIQRDDGERATFIIRSYTLILIKDRLGRIWAGRLNQLQPGWRVTVAYDLPPDDGDMPDKGGSPDVKDADNLIAEVPS